MAFSRSRIAFFRSGIACPWASTGWWLCTRRTVHPACNTPHGLVAVHAADCSPGMQYASWIGGARAARYARSALRCALRAIRSAIIPFRALRCALCARMRSSARERTRREKTSRSGGRGRTGFQGWGLALTKVRTVQEGSQMLRSGGIL